MEFKCKKCGKPLDRVEDLAELQAIPFDWYLKPDIVEKEVILHCKVCNMFLILSPFDKIRFRIASKIMGQGA